MGANKTPNELENRLSDVIINLEKSLMRIIDRADNIKYTGDKKERTNNRDHLRYDWKNPYDKDKEQEKLKIAQKYIEEREDFDKKLAKKRIENQIALWNNGYKNAIKEQERFQLESQLKRNKKEIEFWILNKNQIKEQEEFQLESQFKRRQKEIGFWEHNKKYIKEQERFQLELQDERKQKEIEFWKYNKKYIKQQEEYQLELQDKRKQSEIDLWKRNKKEIKEQDEFQLELQNKRKKNELDLWKSKGPIIKDQEEFQLELQKKRKENELDLWESKGPIIKDQEEFQLEQQKKRREKELDFFEVNKDKIQDQEDYQFEQQQKRKQAELDFFELNKDKIQSQEDYQFEQQQKRKQAELDFFDTKKSEIEKIDELENSLIERRNAKQLRSRTRAAELEKASTDEQGRTKSNKERKELINKFKEFSQENTPARATGIAINKVAGKMTQGVDFLSSDKKVSISDVGNKLADAASKFGAIGGAIGGIFKLIASAVEAYDKINAASSKYARSVGGGVTKMEQMKKVSVDVAKNISKIGGNTYKFDEILEHAAELSEKTGRAMDHITDADFKSMEDLRRYGIDNDVLNMYDTFGLSVQEIDKRITSVYQKAGKHGLNAKAVTDAVNKNLKMAQQYTFASGQRALERMAEKSVALKYNLESVSKFADKVSTLEGAATAGAQLSVLGGNFARMGNPLSMLYGGLQDPERLNEYMINMVQGMAHWDSQKGQIDLAAADRMRLKAASEATGVDYTDFLNMAMNQEKQNIIAGQISGITDTETQKYIKNIATIKQNEETGKAEAWVKINGVDKKVNDLRPEDKEALKQESENMEEKNAAGIGDIYEKTRTISDKLNNYIDWIRTRFFEVILKIAGYDSETLGAMNKYGLDAEDAQKVVEKERSGRLWGAGVGAGLGVAGGVAAGAAIGTAIAGPVGTALGALAGLAITAGGAGAGYAIGDAANSSDAYAKELSKQDKYKKRAKGSNQPEGFDRFGTIPAMDGFTSKDDGFPAYLAPGEMVMNAAAVQEHAPQLKAWNEDKVHHYSNGTQPDETVSIKAVEDQTKPMQVNPVESSIMGIGGMSIEPLTINPITINVTGTINLTGGGESKSLDIAKIIDDNTFISSLTRKLEETINRRFNASETNSHMPYYIQPMLMA